MLWRMQTQQKKKPMLGQLAPMHWKLPKRKETPLEVRQITSITIYPLHPAVTYLSWTNLFLVILIGHTPSTITSASLKSLILNHGQCGYSGPFEEVGSVDVFSV